MPAPQRATLRGRLVDPSSKLGVEGVRVDVWDKETKETVAVAWTDEEGLFSAALPELPEEEPEAGGSGNLRPGIRIPGHLRPTLSATRRATLARFAGRLRPTRVTDREPKVSLGERYELRLADTLESAKVESVSRLGESIEAVLSGTPRAGRRERIEVKSFRELLAKEGEIVKRINGLRNGGQLFLIHPFLTLAEVGVVLSREARAEIVKREPRLRSLSAVPFHALRTSAAKQKLRVKIRGLFRRES